MVDPNNWRGVAIQLAEFRRYVLAFLGALIAATSWGAYELYNLKSQVSVTDNRVKRMEEDLKEVRGQTANTKQILEIVERIDARQQRVVPTPSPTVPTWTVSDAEASFIRDQLKLPPRATTQGKISIGDFFPEKQTAPLPDAIVGKLPKLKGVRFVVDSANNAIALLDAGTNKVFALI